MFQRLAICLACCGLLSIVGCQSGTNPFYPATQIPPPPTGAASKHDPYYQPDNRIGQDRDRSSLARRNRRTEFSSDDRTERNDSRIDRGSEEPEMLDTSLDGNPELDDLGRSEIRNGTDLNWLRSSEADVIPASAYESSRPRPRVRY